LTQERSCLGTVQFGFEVGGDLLSRDTLGLLQDVDGVDICSDATKKNDKQCVHKSFPADQSTFERLQEVAITPSKGEAVHDAIEQRNILHQSQTA